MNFYSEAMSGILLGAVICLVIAGISGHVKAQSVEKTMTAEECRIAIEVINTRILAIHSKQLVQLLAVPRVNTQLNRLAKVESMCIRYNILTEIKKEGG